MFKPKGNCFYLQNIHRRAISLECVVVHRVSVDPFHISEQANSLDTGAHWEHYMPSRYPIDLCKVSHLSQGNICSINET